jgi:hypothetical protein
MQRRACKRGPGGHCGCPGKEAGSGFEHHARAICATGLPQSSFEPKAGAGEGNRTLVCSLGSCRSAIELRPQSFQIQEINLGPVMSNIFLAALRANEAYELVISTADH